MKRLIPAVSMACVVTCAMAASPNEGAPRFDALAVVDSDGKLVGSYTYSFGDGQRYPVVLFDDGGTLTELTLDNAHGSSLLTFISASAIYHESKDCSGAAYISAPPMGVRPGAVIEVGKQKFVFYLADNDERLTLDVRSEGTPADCQSMGGTIKGLSLTSSPPLNLNRLFKLPLHVR